MIQQQQHNRPDQKGCRHNSLHPTIIKRRYRDMRNRIVKVIAMVLATVLLTGADCTTAGEQTETRADNRTDNRITETTNNMNKWDNTEVYFTRTKEDYNKMTDILENRNGKIIIKVIETTVLDNEGNASDAFGFYVKYESGKYEKGDRVQTAFVYNPENNYLDDILYRFDTLI